MEVMEETISGAIVRSYFKKLESNLAVDVAIVGAGPSGLVVHKRLPEILVVPREKTPTGAAARGNP